MKILKDTIIKEARLTVAYKNEKEFMEHADTMAEERWQCIAIGTRDGYYCTATYSKYI